MPQAIPIIVAVVAQQGAQAIVMAVISAVISTYTQYRAKKAASDAARNAKQDRTITIRGAIAARRFVLGRARIGGVFVYGDTFGLRKKRLDQVLAMCEGPISRFHGVYFNDEFVSEAGFSGGYVTGGQYSAGARRAIRTTETRTLSAASSFTLTYTPLSVGSTLVNIGTGDGTEPLTVSSISGTTVNLSAPATGTVYVDYSRSPDAGPLQVQFLYGTRDQTVTDWAGLSTPKWTADHRLRGIAGLRVQMDWEPSVFAQGAPQLSAVIDGVMPYDPRANRHPNARLVGATDSALATQWATAVGGGLTQIIKAAGSEDGIPYSEIQYTGTASASGSIVISLPAFASAPSAISGQVWGARVYCKLVSGGFSGIASKFLDVGQFSSGGTFTVKASTALTKFSEEWMIDCDEEAEGTFTTGAAKAGAQLRFTFNSGAAVNFTVRVGLPQLWHTGADPVRWSANNAVLAYWYMRLPRRLAGCGIPVEWISESHVIAAANVCDEDINVKTITGGGYENINRYECHTVISADAAPMDNLGVIIDAMAGDLAFTAGEYRMWAGAARASTFVLDDSHVVPAGGIRFEPDAGGLESPPNVINGTIADAYQNWTDSAVTPVVNETYVVTDGGEEHADLDLPATTDPRQASYLMGVELEKQRPGFRCTLMLNEAGGANLAVGDCGTIDLEAYPDFSGMKWEVRKRVNNFDGTYSILLQQCKDWRWALDPETWLPVDPPDPVDNTYLWDVADVEGLTATSGGPARLPDGTALLQLVVTWLPHSQDYVQQSGTIELRYRRADDVGNWSSVAPVDGSATGTTISVAGTDASVYVVEARAINGLGAYSDWASTGVGVNPGTDIRALTSRLTRVEIVLQAANDGTVSSYTGATTTAQVLLNGADDTSNWTFSRANGSGVTSSLSGATLTVTAVTAGTDVSYVDITGVRSGFPNQILRVGISKAKAGSDATPDVPPVLQTVGAVHIVTDPADATAGVRVERDGDISTLAGASWTQRARWWSGTPGNPGDLHHVRFTYLPGSSVIGSGGGSWLALTSDRSVSISRSSIGSESSQVLIELSDDGGTTVISTGVVYLGPVVEASGP